MDGDQDELEGKKSELLNTAERAASRVIADPSEVARSAVEAFTNLTAPVSPPVVLRLITLNMLHAGGGVAPAGQSRKPGNIVLNWSKLIDIVPDVTIAAAGAAAAPAWLLPLIGLYVWNKFWRGAEEQLTDAEATAILALWKNRNGENEISEDRGYEKTNSIRRELGLPALSSEEFASAIDRLLQMKCIEMNDGIIWLREWVRIRY